ncbi:hypothetical protein HPT27_10285 [Permianibacter sp. IMCC34836]|uniref:hypothetical protein n=1 Tax=Permianibacter fluminis TaxID=2738515 RepID=UPI0015562F79|nr:hypothetical protein [Permianibacter fluminis]NQD37418.1 hypothetical protein [Permianibacter fluminis]
MRIALVLSAMLLPCYSYADDWNTELGLGASVLRTRNGGKDAEQDLRPNVYLRIYRPVNSSWQLGTSVEWLIEEATNWGGSENVLMWRLADLDYRLSNNLAFSFHGGIARYFREQPSYGYGYGFGLKYRLSSEWIVAAELTASDVDVSTDVPTDEGRSTKDDLKWASVRLSYTF